MPILISSLDLGFHEKINQSSKRLSLVGIGVSPMDWGTSGENFSLLYGIFLKCHQSMPLMATIWSVVPFVQSSPYCKD